MSPRVVSEPCRRLSACLLALLRSCYSSCCLSTSHHHCRPQWTRGRTRFSQPLPLALLVRAPLAHLRHCPALSGFVGSHLPRQRIHSHHRIPTGTPAPRQSVSQSIAPRLALLFARPTDRPGSDFSTTSPESSARAGPDIYLLPVASSPPVISSTSPHLRQSRFHHPATPPPTTTRQPDQPFACGRPIHLATSSPNKTPHRRFRL